MADLVKSQARAGHVLCQQREAAEHQPPARKADEDAGDPSAMSSGGASPMTGWANHGSPEPHGRAQQRPFGRPGDVMPANGRPAG